MPRLHVAIVIYLTIWVLDSWQELPLKGESKNAGICSVVGEVLLHNATVQLGPGNGEGGGRVLKLSSLGKHVEHVLCSVSLYVIIF